MDHVSRKDIPNDSVSIGCYTKDTGVVTKFPVWYHVATQHVYAETGENTYDVCKFSVEELRTTKYWEPEVALLDAFLNKAPALTYEYNIEPRVR